MVHLEKKDSLNIPNYLPIVDLYVDYFTIDMNEEETIKRKLLRPTDRNPEDNPVSYISVSSPDQNSIAFFNDAKDSLIITGKKDVIGPYYINLTFESSSGGIRTDQKSGYIQDMFDIQGVLEYNENHQR